jgi:hypothetical protein
VGWLLTFAVVLGIGAAVFSWVKNYGLAAVPDPSVSESASTAGTGAPLLAVNGYWCPPGDEEPCITVLLPSAIFDGDDAEPLYVYPPDADASASPDDFTYGFEANLGECWQATANSLGGNADAAFIFCPAGATSGDDDLDASDPSVDRLWITQDLAAEPYVRATQE